MTAISIDMYKDGGTFTVTTDLGTLYIDRRIASLTKGWVFNDYPERGAIVDRAIASALKSALEDVLAGNDNAGIETDIPKIAKVIKVPVLKWPGRCHEIAGLILKAKLVPEGSKLCYGVWHGPISDDSVFAGRSLTHHGWIALPDGRIFDPTRWCFTMVEPSIFVGRNLKGFYDFGGNNLRERLMDCSKPPEPHGNLIPVPLKYRTLFARFIASPKASGDVAANQLMWMASLPLARLGENAKAVYTALVSMKLGAFIPIDNREAILS